MTTNRNGSFLFNMGIMLVIVLVLLSVTVPQFSFFSRYLIRTELEKLHAVFYYMQQRAASVNEPQKITFNLEDGLYCYAHKIQQLPVGIKFGFLPRVNGPPSSPSSSIKKAITFKNDSVIFYPDGTIQSGTVYVTDDDETMMYALTSPISQISYVRKYCYDNAWVQI